MAYVPLGRTKSQQRSNVTAGLTLQGDRELLNMLNALPDRVFAKVVKRATNSAMTPVLRDAKKIASSNLIKDTGLLAESLGRKQKVYKRSGIVVVIVGPRKGFKRKVERNYFGGEKKMVWADPLHYAHLVEFGHRLVHGGALVRKDTGRLPAGKKLGKEVGFVPPRTFIRAALDKNRAEILNRLKRQIGIGTEREATKLLRGASWGF